MKSKISMLVLAIMLFSLVTTSVSASNIDKKSEIFTVVDIQSELATQSKELSFDNMFDNYDTVITNPKLFREDVSDGQVKLNVKGQKFDINLEKIGIVDDNAKIITGEGNNVSILDIPKISTYEGSVVGEKNSSVIFTVADDVLIGDIYLKNETYSIEQTTMLHNEKVVHVITSSKDEKKDRIIKEYNTDDSIVDNPRESNLSANIVLDISSLLRGTNIDIMASYDSDFNSEYSNPTAEIQNILSGVDSYAFSDANVDLNIKTYRYYTNIPEGTNNEIYNDFKDVAEDDRDSTSSDLAFLFSGKEMDDEGIGTGAVYTGSSGQAYAVAQMVSAGTFSSYQASSTGKRVLTAHELGHNFGATHNEAYTWGNWPSYYTCMRSPFEGTSYPNYMQIEFSNLNDHGDSSHNNILHVVSNKGTIAGFQ
jgi:hypothetical protein